MTAVVTTREPQQATTLGFITARLFAKDRRDRERCWGISSDALALYGVEQRSEPGPRDYPSDRSDLAACERTYLMAPDHVRERMLPVLEKYRAHVADRHPEKTP